MGAAEALPSASACVALMDRWTLAGLVTLVVWAVVTFAFAPAPGAVHLLLTAGVFLLVYGAVVRGTRAPGRPAGGPTGDA